MGVSIFSTSPTPAEFCGYSRKREASQSSRLASREKN